MSANSIVRSHPVPFATVTFAPTESNDKSTKQTRPKFQSETDVDLGSLDGLRAIACLAVVCFHCTLFWGLLLNWKTSNSALDESPLLRLASNGNAGVDVFLVLTGLWATVHLIPALNQASKIDLPSEGIWNIVRRYYRKRIFAVLPPYVTTLLLVLMTSYHAQTPDQQRNKMTVMAYCPKSLPLNLLFLNNFAGFAGCGTLYWTLAVQVHFYAAFPLILLGLRPKASGFRSRVASLARTTFVVSALLRWGMAHLFNAQLPLPAFAHPELTPAMASAAVRYYHPLYFNTFARLGNLATGVLLGLILTSPHLPALRNRNYVKFIVAMSAIVSCTALVFGVFAPKLYSATAGDTSQLPPWAVNYSKAFAAFAYHGSPLYCAAAGFLILSLVLHNDPVSSVVAQVCNWAPVTHIGKLSYHIYLLHMIVLYWLEALLLPQGFLQNLVQSHPLRGYIFILGLAIKGSYAAAFVHHWVHQNVIKKLWLKDHKLNGLVAVDVKPKYM